MRIRHHYRLEMFKAIERFGEEQESNLRLSAYQRALFAKNSANIAAINGAARDQVSGAGSRQKGTHQRALIANELLHMMQSIAAIARALDPALYPGLVALFPVPRPKSYKTLLPLARSYAKETASLQEIFVDRGMPADFRQQLERIIAKFVAASALQSSGQQGRTGNTASLKHLVKFGMATVRELRASLHYQLRAKPALETLWRRVSRVRSEARRHETTSSEEQPLVADAAVIPSVNANPKLLPAGIPAETSLQGLTEGMPFLETVDSMAESSPSIDARLLSTDQCKELLFSVG